MKFSPGSLFVVAAGLLLSATLPSPAAHILLIRNTGGDSTSQSLHDFLVTSGHTVTRDIRTGGPGNLAGIDLIIIARETNSGNYSGAAVAYNTAPVPIINMAPHIMRLSIWGWANGNSLQSIAALSAYDSPFPDPSHPIVFGQSASLLSPGFAAHANANSLPAGAVELATLDGGSAHGIFVIPAGTPMFGGLGTAGHVRIGFLRGNEGSWNNITANGEQILINTINWALGLTADPPAVVNSAAAGIGPSSATVGGQVTDTGGAIPIVTIHYGDNDGGTNSGLWDHSISLGSQAGAFATEITGLSPSTTYYFRSFATNPGGDAWASSTASFTTAAPPDPPTIVNQPATNIDYTLAELNGEVTSTGGEVPEVIIYFGDNNGGTNPIAWDNASVLGQESGSFSREVVGLTHNTTYYFRCFAQNSGGAAWAGSTASFTTSAYGLPAVVTLPASGVTGIAASANGEVTATGGDEPAVTIFWGDHDGGTSAASWDAGISLGVRGGGFSAVLTGLSPLTTYYYRAFAQNAAGSAWAPATQSFTTPDTSELVINEFLASNDGTYSNYPNPGQVTGRLDDWIEILNTGTSTLSLAGWHLTDDPGQPNRWTFPPGTALGPGQFLLVYASNDNMPDANGNLHTDFALNAGGEHVALVRPDLTVASEFGPGGSEYPGQSADVSYGIHPATALPVFFAVPTPGAPNSAAGIARVADTKFSVNRGLYSAPFEVAITTDTAGATIYFTTDGEDPVSGAGAPTSTASVYSGPVPVTRTTVLRAAAVKSGLSPTNIDTHTYLLIDAAGAAANGLDPGGLNAALLEQTQPAGYPTLSNGGSSEDDADYDMDQTISKSTAQAAGLPAGTSRAKALVQGLGDIPTFSIAMNIDDFAGGTNGIYTHATSRGMAWERACSAEFIAGDNSFQWQENCGIRIQGGASRNRDAKHSFNFRFRDEYGAGKLREKLFPDTDVEEFNVLVLRAEYNNSWTHWSEAQRDAGSLIRDQWARDTMLEMGHPDAGAGRMVHVYVNGLYWGVYNLCERQDAAHYAAYHGGDEDFLDARNGTQFIDGNSTAFNAMVGVVNGGNWSDIQQVLDVDQYIDYQIMNRYGANHDLKVDGNWRAAGGGPFTPGNPTEMAQWKIYAWDSERILESPSATNEPIDPFGIRGTLEGYPEYRLRFADRLQKHFFYDGALTPERAVARWLARAAELDRAIIAEAARWGDHRNDNGDTGDVYTRNTHWLVEQARLVNSYFPVRSANVLNKYRNDGDFPATAAPVFHVNGSPQHGGEIPSGGTLSLASSAGTIYYTTDGSDPRLAGGAVNPGALPVSSGSAISLPASGLVRARVLGGGEWSALNEATYFLEALAGVGDVVMAEIHYHPTPPSLLEQQAGAALLPPQVFTDADFEFVELLNVSGETLNLAGLEVAGGVAFTFPSRVVADGARAVLVSNPQAFAIRYPGLGGVVAGTFTGSLDNAGEALSLVSTGGGSIAEFAYEDSGAWPGRADGSGSSLELVADGLDPGDSESWRASCEYNGSPGTAGIGIDGRVVINEVLSHSDSPAVDAIELFNPTASPVTITGWYLSDRNDPALAYHAFRLPAMTLQPGGYASFDESDFNPVPGSVISTYSGTIAAPPTTVTSFSHGLSDGDVITIDGYGGVGGYNDTFEVDVLTAHLFTIDTPFLDNANPRGNWTRGRPFGLSSSDGETLYLLEADGAGNPVKFVDVVDFAAARAGETLGRWPNGAGTGTLVTMTASTLGAANAPAMVGPVIISEVMYQPGNFPENSFEFVEICNSGQVAENLANWRLRGGVDFDFTGAHRLAPAQVLVVVGFDPVNDPVAADNFRSAYGIDASINLAGPWTDGPLRNDTGTVRLQRPDDPPAADPAFYPQVTEDEIVYFSSAPWPAGAAGSGDSLQRDGSGLFGNFPSSWTAAAPNPGGKLLDYSYYRDLTFGPGSPPGSGPLEDFDLDGILNAVEYALGLDPLVFDANLAPAAFLDNGQLVLTFSKNTLLTDVACEVHFSTDLATWTPLADVLVSTLNYVELRRASIAVAPHQRLFLRIALTQ